MPTPVPLRRQIAALAVGLAGGAVAFALGLPLPWMLGAMIAVTAAALLGRPIAAPEPLRPVVIPVLGVMLGSSLTAEVLTDAPRWALSMLLLVPYLAATSLIGIVIYRRLGGYDPVTAYFAAVPGGLSEMLLMGTEAGGDARRIALAHSTRILVTVVLISLYFGLVLGARAQSGTGGSWVAFAQLSPADWAWLVGSATLGAWLGLWLRLPAGGFMGPLCLSGLAHATGLVHLPPPSLLVVVAQVAMGTIIGSRFSGVRLAEIGRDLMLAFLTTLSALACAALFAALVSMLTGIAQPQAILAYSPGGLTEMSLLALAMDQDVAYVSLSHVARIFLLLLAAPAVFRLLRPKPPGR